MNVKNRKLFSIIIISFNIAAWFSGCSSKNLGPNGTPSGSNMVNVYSSRYYDVDREIFKKFQDETGILVNIFEGKGEELVKKIVSKDDELNADLLLTVGAENIYSLRKKNILQNIDSEIINDNIPSQYRDTDWVGLTSWDRVIVYNNEKAASDMIKTYEDLLRPEFRERVLVRSSESMYNVAMVESFIMLNGEEKTKEWAEGLVKNFARTPEGNDRDQVKALIYGIGDVALINSYYFGKVLNSTEEDDKKAAEKLGIVFPENSHKNISFAVIPKESINKNNAIRLLEFLTSEYAQSTYSKENLEFPLNPKAEVSEILQQWGNYSTQNINFGDLGEYENEAEKIFKAAEWK